MEDDDDWDILVGVDWLFSGRTEPKDNSHSWDVDAELVHRVRLTGPLQILGAGEVWCLWHSAAPYSSMEESPGRGSRIRETRHWIDGSI